MIFENKIYIIYDRKHMLFVFIDVIVYLFSLKLGFHN